MKKSTIIKMLFFIATAVFFILGYLKLSEGNTNTGRTFMFLSAISLFFFIALYEAFDGSYGMAGAMAFVALVFVALLVNNIQGRVEPVVTESHVMNSAYPDGPYEMTDTNLLCCPVPVSREYYFQCVGWQITRYTRCKNCGRRFLDHYHYSAVISLEKWQKKISWQRAQNEAFANCPEL